MQQSGGQWKVGCGRSKIQKIILVVVEEDMNSLPSDFAYSALAEFVAFVGPTTAFASSKFGPVEISNSGQERQDGAHEV